MNPAPANGQLRELAAIFFRLGVTAFGGPAAHIAMMQREVVERRKWLSAEEFLDLLAATNFIPGPNSTEIAIHVGHRRAGWKGLVVAGACFIVPAVVLTLCLAWAYVHFGELPATAAVLYGIQPVIVAIVAQALWALGRAAVKNKFLALLGVSAAGLNVVGVNELVVLLVAGCLSALQHDPRAPVPSDPTDSREPRARSEGGKGTSRALFFGLPSAAGTVISGATSYGVFLVFLKIGSVLFGSGYVLLAFLRAELVEGRHWLTEGQLLDAVAAGQMTPGPVFSTATFVGYLLRGWSGAAAATAGIFLPAFFFVAISGPLVPRLRRSPRAAHFLDGLNVASLALMAVVSFRLGRAAVVDPWTAGLLAVSGAVLLLFEVNSVWLMLGGALVGNVVRWLGWRS